MQCASEESFYDLFNNLLKVQYPTYNVLDEKACKSTRSQILLSLLKHQSDTSSENTLSLHENLIWIAHVLRSQRKFDEASLLVKFIKYFDDEGLFENADFQNMLVFLLALKNTSNTNDKEFSMPSPWLLAPNQEHRLPNVPLNFNDTRTQKSFAQWHYTHFPSSVFQVDKKVESPGDGGSLDDFAVCNSKPGMNSKMGFFEMETPPDKGLFGALVGPNRRKPLELDAALSIPELPSEQEGSYDYLRYINSSATFPKKESSSPTMCPLDEGYASCHSSDMGNGPLCSRDINWESVAKDKEGVGSNWDNLGSSHIAKEKPFTSECQEDVISRLWHIDQSYEVTFNSGAEIPDRKQVSAEQFLKDVAFLLTGTPSENFGISEVTCSFSAKPNLCFDGVTSETLSPHLVQLLACGSRVYRIDEFCSPSSTDNGTMWSFKQAIKAFLLGYRQRVFSLLNESKGKKFLTFKLKTGPLMDTVDLVFNLCSRFRSASISKCTECEQNSVRCPKCKLEGLKSGLGVIDRIKKELDSPSRPESHFYLLLHFLIAACKPFLSVLEKWIYDGELIDSRSDFVVKANPKMLALRDRNYWTKGYSVEGAKKFVPDFLKTVFKKAFVCGKTLNLLKVCVSKNLPFFQMMSEHPPIVLTASLKKMERMKQKRSKYISDVSVSLQKSRLTLKEYDESLEKCRLDLVESAVEADRRYQENFQRVQNNKNEQNRLLKKQNFDRLKEDMAEHELAKEKRLKIEEFEEEKRILKDNIFEEERKLKQNRKKSALISEYQSKMMNFEDKYLSNVHNAISKTQNGHTFEFDSHPETSKSVYVDQNLNPVVKDPENYRSGLNADKNILNGNGIMELNGNKTNSNEVEVNGNTEDICVINNNKNIQNDNDNPCNKEYNGNIPSMDIKMNIVMESKDGSTKTSVAEPQNGEITDSKLVKDTQYDSNGRNEKLMGKMNEYDQQKEIEHPVLIDKVPVYEIHGISNKSSSPFSQESFIEEHMKKLKTRPVKAYSTLMRRQKQRTSFLAADDCSEGEDNDDDSANIRMFTKYIERELLEHITLQSEPINEVLLSHFLIEKKLLEHFEVLKNFVLLCDANFGRCLTLNISKKFPLGCPLKCVNPSELNSILDEALSVSPYKCSLTSDLAFFVSRNSEKMAVDAFDVLDLRLHIRWPLNIVLDEDSANDYAVLFKFIARLHLVQMSIEDTYTHMNLLRSSLVGASNSPQFHKMLIYRHEVQAVVHVLLGYIFYQAIEGSWASFQEGLREKTRSLDDLYETHRRFLRDVTEKCFLTPNFGQIRNQIEEICSEAVLFRNLTMNHPWRLNTSSGQVETVAFENIEASFQKFRTFHSFLRKSLEMLLRYTQFSHIEDLVMQLDFNDNFVMEY